MSNGLRPSAPPVPTLTEVVPVAGASTSDLASANVSARQDVMISRTALEDQILHQVLQRVDLVLEARIAQAVQAVVAEQTKTLIPRLREEVELAVRLAVMAAVSAELDGR